jgi:hypothetical protein
VPGTRPESKDTGATQQHLVFRNTKNFHTPHTFTSKTQTTDMETREKININQKPPTPLIRQFERSEKFFTLAFTFERFFVIRTRCLFCLALSRKRLRAFENA